MSVVPTLERENYIKEIENGLEFVWVESEWRQKVQKWN